MIGLRFILEYNLKYAGDYMEVLDFIYYWLVCGVVGLKRKWVDNKKERIELGCRMELFYDLWEIMEGVWFYVLN